MQRGLNTKLKGLLCLFLTLVLLVGTLPGTVLAEDTETGGNTRIGGADVTNYITFSNEQLTGPNGTVNQGNGITFTFGSYTFTINFAVDMAAMNSALGKNGIEAGDYFTFTVPEEFKNLSYKIYGPDGLVWAEVTTDSTGGGKVVFTDATEGKANVSGSLGFTGSYQETTAGVSNKWEFEFGTTYTYEGESKGNTSTEPIINSTGTAENRKSADGNRSGTQSYAWSVFANRNLDSWTGTIKISDTLGSGHKMTVIPSGLSLDKFAYYGLDHYDEPDYYGRLNADMGNYYFAISLIDWAAMRADYNGYITWSLDNGKDTLWVDEDGDGTYGDSRYALTALVDGDTFTSYMTGKMFNWKKADGSYRYAEKYTGGLENVTVTNSGYEITFPAGALNGKSAHIYYFTELTAIIPPDKLVNSVTISGAGEDKTLTAENTVKASGTITGTVGEIAIYKYDSDEQIRLSGAEFQLTESSLSYDDTQTTTNGYAAFTLSTSGYAGDYTLTEITPPPGYAALDPMSITINASGEITDINGTPIPAGTATTVYDNGNNAICKVSPDRLIIVVYNQEIPQPTPGTVTLEGTKTLTGRTLEAGEFSFVLKDNAGTTIETVSNLADGSFDFSALTFSAAGTYTYTVEEAGGTLGGITYDTKVYDVTITVVDDGAGNLTATPSYSVGGSSATGINFANSYSVTPTTVTLTGTKTLSGNKTLEAGMFNFVVKDASGNSVATASNAADGSITFSPINLTAAGTYVYTVSEIEGNIGGSTWGIIYDTKVHTVTVTVTDNGAGQLAASVAYPADGIVFNNLYVTTNASVPAIVDGTKVLTGKALEADMFSFVLTDDDNNGAIVSTGTNNADGTIRFGLDYAAADIGTYHYTIKEVDNNVGGVTYDSTQYHVTVEVKDNGFGLETEVTYEDGAIVFNNTYNADSTSVTLKGTKKLTGKDLTDDMFGFVVKDENGNVVSTATNHADGTIHFGAIHYTATGTYTYTVSEIKGNADKITYDDTEYGVTVTVTDNGTGQLLAAVTYDDGDIVFTNKYSTSDTSNPDASDPGTSSPGNNPATGDNGGIFLWALLCCGAFAAGAILTVVTRRRRYR